MDYIEFYKTAYACLEHRTPVMFDCGELCWSSCCQNNGKGMLLFPHEEEFISSLTSDFILIDSEITICDYTVRLLLCNGTCDRRTRPLACRIFPLFPFLASDGEITVGFDPRAKGTCPLLFTDMDELHIGGLFRLSVLKVASILKEDPLVRTFLLKISEELDTIKSFRL